MQDTLTVDVAHWVLFVVNDQRYAVQSAAVDQIVHLPVLTTLPHAQDCLAGVFHLHGTMVPVLDLATLVNRPLNRYFATDSVIVLHGSGRPLGIIANQVIDVRTIARSEEEAITQGPSDKSGRNLIEGVARVENEIVLLLDSEQLLRQRDAVEGFLSADNLRGDGRLFHQKIAPGETEIFRERTRRLIPQVGEENQDGFLELAVIRLSGEFFGLPLKHIREFCEVRDVTPVPCCPEHITGTTNLRGEILTVIDVCPILRLPPAKMPRKKIVVLDCGALITGVGIDDICDLVYADPAQIARLPLAAEPSASKYLRGTVAYGNHVLTILDTEKLLNSQELVVNDEI